MQNGNDALLNIILASWGILDKTHIMLNPTILFDQKLHTYTFVEIG